VFVRLFSFKEEMMTTIMIMIMTKTTIQLQSTNDNCVACKMMS